ncbi:MAG: hypothetical protein KatS3mg029_0716 [Saprospiraceae bacterium]|nr:MAG: hypothetical protein KatS3mg029_0716 [Saprospiraceae bacterium]
MRNLFLILIGSALLGWLLHQALPFWAIALGGFVMAIVFFYPRPIATFAAGFLGGFLLWAGLAMWIDHRNGGQLSSQLALLFQTEAGYLAFASGLFGGLLAAFGALTGHYTRKLFFQSDSGN